VQTLDGIKYRFADGGWLLFRPSGTEPLLRVYAEAGDEHEVQQILRAACDVIDHGTSRAGKER
jgi:phosphomannomutase